MSRKQGEQMDDFNSNVRRFQSNQSISVINNIHMDLFIELFDRGVKNVDGKTKSVKLYIGVQFCKELL